MASSFSAAAISKRESLVVVVVEEEEMTPSTTTDNKHGQHLSSSSSISCCRCLSIQQPQAARQIGPLLPWRSVGKQWERAASFRQMNNRIPL